jgi:CheY-like chemotaxis protein
MPDEVAEPKETTEASATERKMVAEIDGAQASSIEVEASPGEKPAKTADKPVAVDSPYANISKKHILVVDDTMPMRKLLAKTLQRVGAVVEEAENGHEALDHSRKAYGRQVPFDLILLDLMMPGMNGFETLQHLRADPDTRKTPVIVVTAKGDRDSLIKCAKYKVAGYILKPFSTQKIIETIEQLFTKKEEKPAEPVGLTLEQVAELRQILLETARRAIDEKLSTAENAENELVAKTALEYIDSHCPGSKNEG